MNWLSKLDELAKEELNKNSRKNDDDNLMMIDPLLDGDLHCDDEKTEIFEQNEEKKEIITINEGKLIHSEREVRSEDEAFVDNVSQSSLETIVNLSDNESIIETNGSRVQIETSDERDDIEEPSIFHQPTGDVTAEGGDKKHISRNHGEDQLIESLNPGKRTSQLDREQESKASDAINKSKGERKGKKEEIANNKALGILESVTENLPMNHLSIDQKFITESLAPIQNVKNVSKEISKFIERSSASITSTISDFDINSNKNSDHLSAENIIPPKTINIGNEKSQPINFDLVKPLQQWSETSAPLDDSKNCMGVVQVRVLAAQRLMCPIGSTVQPVASLIPWKGKVRGECTNSFGNDEKGVCVKWDTLSEASCCSMVHAGRDALVIPTIKLELIFKPLPLLEFSMCSLKLCCRPLMMQHGIWKKQWCEAKLSDQFLKKEFGEHENPLILVEAAFFPALDENPNDENNENDETQPVGVSTIASPTISSPSIVSSHVLKTNNRLHLFKLQSLLRPSECSICKRSIIGWKRAFRCETCGIDCCKDCRVQIDYQIPCGSDLARRVVEESIQSKFNVNNILKTLAPVDEKYEQHVVDRRKKTLSKRASFSISTKEKFEDTSNIEKNRCIGQFCITVDEACIFESPLPLETDPGDIFDVKKNLNLKKGDYYVRVTCISSSQTNRTITVPSSGKPKFSSPELVLDVPHYGAEYRLEMVDAYNNKTIGTALLTAQALLQLQRDSLLEKYGLLSFLPSIRNKLENFPTTLKLELRAGIKKGFETTYSLPKKTSKSDSSRVIPGSISGWITLEASVKQEFENLYGQNAIECPSRSPNKLDLELVQLHISRIFSLFGCIQDAFKWYFWLTSWDDPPITFFSLIIFVWSCFRFNLEYIGCLPIMLVVFVMSINAIDRRKGRLKQRFIQRQEESCVKEMLEHSVDRSIFRPFGGIEVNIKSGRNLRSQELGISGSVACHVFWHPLRYSESEEDQKKLISQDKILESRHDIGQTNYVFDVNPKWNKLIESSELQKMQRLSPNLEALLIKRDTNRSNIKLLNHERENVVFPFLQPICRMDKVTNSSLESWTSIRGAIVVQVRFGDVINRLPGFKDNLGEVVIPLSKVVLNKRINGWFQVTNVNSTHAVRHNQESDQDAPCINLSLRWLPPDRKKKNSEAYKEASITIEEEMILSASSKASAQEKSIGNSLGSLNNTVRGIGGTLHTIQNTIGQVVDILEVCHNIITFADPQISSFILFALFLVCLLLSLVPTRVFVFLMGLVQYLATLIPKLRSLLSLEQTIKSQKTFEMNKNDEKLTQTSSPISTWITNAYCSIPTDEDLRKAYFWEGRRFGEQACLKIQKKKRITRLEKLWNARWFSSVKVRNELTPGNEDNWQWQDGYFAVVLSRQLLIWISETSFDAGEVPWKQINFSGHAGIAGLSPIELRNLSEDEVKRATNIFGRGEDCQLKITLLLPDKSTKDSLESVILNTAIKDD